MKLIFESLNDTRVKGEVCTETAILNCINDIKNIVRESTEESKKEEKKGLGARTLEMLKAGYKKVLEFLMKIINTINDFRKRVWSKIKSGAKAGKESKEESAQSTAKPKDNQLAIGYKTYQVYDCIRAKTNVKSVIDDIVNKEIVSNITDATERNKKIDEVFYTSMYGGKGATTYTELPKTEANIDEIDRAIKFLQEQAQSLANIIKSKEKELNNPRLKDELIKTIANETLVAASRIAANIGNIITHLLSAFKK